jgi:hypothetical protein
VGFVNVLGGLGDVLSVKVEVSSGPGRTDPSCPFYRIHLCL